MVKGQCNPDRQQLKKRKYNAMTMRTDINQNIATHKLTPERFNFCPSRIFLFFCQRTIGTFGFALHTNRLFAKPKEPILACTKSEIQLK
jgi:hypothetical protein